MFAPIRLFVCVSIFTLLQLPFFSYGQSSKKAEILDYFSRKPNALIYSRFRGAPSPSKETLHLLERQIHWDESGTGSRNPSGLQLRFEKIDMPATPGQSATERYRVYAAGAPENKVFAFESWPIDKNLTSDTRDVYVNGQGLLMIHRPRPEQEMSFKAGDDELDIMPVTESAEPMRFLLSSMDGQLRIFGTLVPHPVAADDQGCRIEVRIAQPDSTAVLIVIDRFPAKTGIPLVLKSEDATLSETLITDPEGHAVMAAFPYVPGKAQGMLKATAEGPNCLPFVVLPWGPASKSVPKTP